MFKMADVLYAALTVFQGYCLQYFLVMLSLSYSVICAMFTMYARWQR